MNEIETKEVQLDMEFLVWEMEVIINKIKELTNVTNGTDDGSGLGAAAEAAGDNGQESEGTEGNAEGNAKADNGAGSGNSEPKKINQ